MSEVDDVNHPAHYTAGGIECIDAMEAALSPAEFRGFCKGNALKYVWREAHKGGDESLRKAIWYLERAVSRGSREDLSADSLESAEIFPPTVYSLPSEDGVALNSVAHPGAPDDGGFA